MKLIVGLGNPGEKYKNNRHNVGYVVVDALASKIPNSKSQVPNKSQIKIFKSREFMNESGRFVKSLYIRHRIQNINLYIIHDDLDIKLGEYKIQKGRGPKDHKGLLSVYEALETKDFWHVRVGVENRPDRKMAGEDYVLQDFTAEEKLILNKVINEICKKLTTSWV